MKELSIEEKAKAYDEAIRKLRGMMPNWERLSYNGKTFLQDLIYIFPELAESEDEKIRKWIINEIKIKHHNLDDENVDFVDKALAWLEKQAEKKPILDFKAKDWYVSKVDGKIHNIYHSVDKVEPKQEWKQENTGDLTDFENAMMHIGGSFFGENAGLDPNNTNVIKEQANLLLELIPSKKWSEEDSIRLQRIIDFLWYNRKGDTDTIYQQEQDIDWLKSLRPQNRWKPSEEQMNNK